MINNIIEQSPRTSRRAYQADTLVGIAREALLSGVVNVDAIKRWLGAIFPPTGASSAARFGGTARSSWDT